MRLRSSTCRCRPALFCWCALVVVALCAAPVRGQFSSAWAAEEIQLGQRVNLFAWWEGRSSLDGVFVELPQGWSLTQAVAVRQGYKQVALETRRLEDPGRNAFSVAAPYPLQGPYDLVLQAETGGAPGRASWTITPFVRRDERDQVRLIPRTAFRITHPCRQVTPVPAADNRVLAFRGEGPTLMLRRSALPDLGPRASFTLEYWMRTTDLNEIVLSTWNGEEASSYPLEMIVDAGGRLRYYRGRQGQHESMTAQTPVADGQWHHVALTYDADAGWTRLFLDGTAADSLYSPVPPAIYQRADLALGARVPSPYAPAETIGAYTGLLDELRIWPQDRGASAIRRTMRQPLQAAGSGAVVLGFEEAIPSALVEQKTLRTQRVVSDLVFHYPVQNVTAALEGAGVRLTWETNDPHTRVFVVERSRDGRTFEAIGEVEPAGAMQAGTETGTFHFYDADVSDQVVFYRIRQRFESGPERLSGTIKLGIGRQAEGETALVGNFPNPFNPSTTIAYEVREAQRVRVSVWDLSGQQVALLVDREHRPGYYEVRFEAHDLPSGTYFVRLQTRRGTQTHKMILMK